jgi:two-component system response regulator
MNTSFHDVDVLLVEDNPDDAGLVLRELKKNHLGNKIIHLSDGAEALDFIFTRGKYAERKIEDKPKVILLDLKMPKVDGLQVLRAIRSDERTKLIPVVVMTSSKEEKDIIQSYSLGVNAYVVKPVNFEHFSKAVAELGMFWILVNQPPE